MFRGDFGSLLTSVMELRVHPVTVGVKIMGNWMLVPGCIFTGTGKATKENSLPVTDLEVMLNVLVPVLESVME